jgi:methyl-accepting chemotaxis protein PixJ
MVKKINEKDGSAKNPETLRKRQRSFQINLRSKVLVFTFIASTLPVLTVGSVTHYLMKELATEGIINTKEDTETILTRQGRLLLLGTVATALLLGGVAAIVANRLTHPILAAIITINKLGQGNLNTRIAIEGDDELAMLGLNINHMADQLQDLLQKQANEAKERANLLEATQALKNFAIQLSGILNSQDIYTLAVEDIRKALKAERAVICKFDENWQGSIIAESVVQGLPCILETRFNETSLQDYVERYHQGGVLAISNINQADLPGFYIKQFKSFAVKAFLEAPILLGDQLIGLLIVHQCSQPRLWQQTEIDLCEQFARSVGLALERANFLAQSEKGRFAAEIVSQRQREQKEQMQMQLLRLLENIAGASTEDLTVRADTSAGEIDTVAEFFNSMLENLQRIITQVKQAAIQVDSAIAENSQVPNQLTIETLNQADQINKTLDFLAQMEVSIQTVANSANCAATLARTASRAACDGGTTIDIAVKNSMSLQQTIEETTKKVEHLGESTQEVSRSVSLLNQIAMQTNLLAINAGIEVVRSHADGSGQGFAIVTQQVAALASQSAATTQEVEVTLANIQFEISEVVKAMALGTSQVVEEARLVQDTKQNLINIFNACCEIDELVQSISTVTISQVQTSKNVTDQIKEIGKVCEMLNYHSYKLSESMQKIVEISQQLQGSVNFSKLLG